MAFRIQVFICFFTFPFFDALSQPEFTFSSGLILKQRYAPVERELKYENISGSPYLNDEPIEGIVRFVKGKETKSYLRYNAYTDEMEYLEGNKLLVITNTLQITAVYLGNYTFNYMPYSVKSGPTKKGFLVRVVDGDCKLYKKINVIFEDAKPASEPYAVSKPASFIKKPDTWFISFRDELPYQVILEKGAVDHIFEKFDAVRKYAKEENLKGKKSEDFVKAVEYFNSLQN